MVSNKVMKGVLWALIISQTGSQASDSTMAGM
jgi:hypothetical protein